MKLSGLQLLTFKTCYLVLSKVLWRKKSLCGAIRVTCLGKASVACLWSEHMAWIFGGGVCLVEAVSPDDVAVHGGWALCFLATEAALSKRRFLCSKFCYVKGQLVLGTRAQWVQYILVDLSKDVGQCFCLETHLLVFKCSSKHSRLKVQCALQGIF